MGERTKAIIRLITVIVLFVNGFLAMMGKSPISNDEAYAYVSEIVTVLCTAWAWWKNNNITEAAQQAQMLMERLKREKKNNG